MDANVLVRKLRDATGVSFGSSVVAVAFGDARRKKLFPAAAGPFGLRYAFTLKDAVTDCDEWMVPKQPFVELAAEFGLELIEWRNFHDFVGDDARAGGAAGKSAAGS